MNEQIFDRIGNTPLIHLQSFSQQTGCNIFGKAEFMNPGGSVKDRAAAQIIKDAIKNKNVKPGGTIIEGTAGNTGIGIALVANALSLKSIIVVPNNQSQEKIDTFKKIQLFKFFAIYNILHRGESNQLKITKSAPAHHKKNTGR